MTFSFSKMHRVKRNQDHRLVVVLLPKGPDQGPIRDHYWHSLEAPEMVLYHCNLSFGPWNRLHRCAMKFFSAGLRDAAEQTAKELTCPPPVPTWSPDTTLSDRSFCINTRAPSHLGWDRFEACSLHCGLTALLSFPVYNTPLSTGVACAFQIKCFY